MFYILIYYIYRVLPYKIDFGGILDLTWIQVRFRACFFIDVSSGLHGFVWKAKDVSSGLHFEKVYFPKTGGCLERFAYFQNPFATNPAQPFCALPPTPPTRINNSLGDVHRVTLRVYTRFPSSA